MSELDVDSRDLVCRHKFTSREQDDIRLRSLSCWAACLVVAYACLALVGWLVHDRALYSIYPGLAATSIGTAIGFTLSAGVLYGRSAKITRSPAYAFLQTGCAVAVLVAGFYVLSRYVTGYIDAGYLFGKSFGRISPATAACFIIFSVATLTVDVEKGRISAVLATFGLLIVSFDLFGYAYSIKALYGVMPFAAMALPTALAFFVLFLALMLSRPRQGWIQYAVRRDHIGTMFRFLSPAVVLIPFALGGVIARATTEGQFEPPFGFAILAATTTVILGGLVCFIAAWLCRAEFVGNLLAAIVESSDDAVISKKLDGTITSWNRGAENLFGYSAIEAVGQSVTMLLREQDYTAEQEFLMRVGHGEHISHYETVRRRKSGGEVEVSLTLSPIRDSTGEIVGASSIARDITEQRRYELEIRRSNLELEQFAYVASHDLQEPLRMVANYTELLAQRYRSKIDAKADMYIHYASDGARRMQRLITDLLAYSRVGSQAKALSPVRADAVFKNVLRSMQRVIHESGALIEAGSLPQVLADEIQLQQLFQNLIANAIKFRSSSPPHIVVRAASSENQWLFSVADNGIGIEMKYAERIFEMFQRLHERGKYEGTGIGLAIAKRIVDRHGGRIWVESRLGAGSVFFFTLQMVGEER